MQICRERGVELPRPYRTDFHTSATLYTISSIGYYRAIIRLRNGPSRTYTDAFAATRAIASRYRRDRFGMLDLPIRTVAFYMQIAGNNTRYPFFQTNLSQPLGRVYIRSVRPSGSHRHIRTAIAVFPDKSPRSHRLQSHIHSNII